MSTMYPTSKTLSVLVIGSHCYNSHLLSPALLSASSRFIYWSKCGSQRWKQLQSRGKTEFIRSFATTGSKPNHITQSQQEPKSNRFVRKIFNHNSNVKTSYSCFDHYLRNHKQSRNFSSRSQDNVMNVFDRNAKRLQKDRAALSYVGEDVAVYDYLKDEFGYRLSDRICDIKRTFKKAVDLGCGRGHLSKNIYSDMVETLYQCDLSSEMLMRAEVSPEVPTHKMVVDEECFPFEENSLDLVASNLSLHWVNDLPNCLIQILKALKNDGAFVGSMFGGDTLYQLRVSLQLAELEREGGFAPHISPYTTVNDLGNLLTRAGFTMLTIDIDDVTINYPSMFELMYDLKGMAENSCSWRRKPQLHRDTLIAAASIYKEMYGNNEGVPATFQVINFIGWKPDPSQPKAAPRGSATVSIKDIGRLDELTKQMEAVHKNKESSDMEKQKLNQDLETFAKKINDPNSKE